MDELCKEKHKAIDEKYAVHERRLNKHSEEIDELSTDSREYKVQIQNLCKQIGGLTKTLQWFIGMLIGGFVSFFFYAVQSGILK